jgi:glutamine cyclotransferase
MNTRVKLCLLVFSCIVVAILVAATLPGPLVEPPPAGQVVPAHTVAPWVTPGPATPAPPYEVVHTFPHDRFAFTEGLALSPGILIEGTGIRGNSTLRQVNLTTGKIIRERQLADQYFGEGVTVFNDRIVELTEDSHVGLIYNATTFTLIGNFSYPYEGWGIAWDGTSLIASDGTATLHYLDPATFSEVRQVRVLDHGTPVESLNELEYVKGEIYANVWPTDRIVRISPRTGEVTGWIDLVGLLSPEDQALIGWQTIEPMRGHTPVPFEKEACLNGIAYDPVGDRLFVTGKLWPDLFEIRVIR